MIRPKRQVGAVDRVAADRVGVDPTAAGVHPAHVHVLPAPFRLVDEFTRGRPEFPLGGAADEQDVERVPRNVEVLEAVLAAGNDEFDFAPYVGTLENDGVGIAPFHDWESKVNPDLQGKLDEVKAGIIDGSIKVESYLG